MDQQILQDSELILNPDGSIYHLKLREEHVAETVILVGDQGRVAAVSKFFDRVDYKIQNREFVTHTGIYKGAPVTVLSTGIGTDNMDIVLNELHAVVNIDLENRKFKDSKRQLNLIRIGTSGSLQEDIPAGAHIISEFSLGLDGLIYYYSYEFDIEEAELRDKINSHLKWNPNLAVPYLVKGSPTLIEQIGHDMSKGITATATGFYGPQGRRLGLQLSNEKMNESLQSFSSRGLRITNFEMETSGLYSLGKVLGHHCCSCSLILANREKKEFIENPEKAMNGLIQTVLERV
ncbi:MAG: nucleoside phosphorylase [Cyclobacteriaceae bacterium]